MRQRTWWLAAIVLGLLLAMASTHRLSEPPAVRAKNEAGQFDAGRAKARLARVLGDQAPHPADTAASDGVRDRLVAELRAMGLRPRVDDRFACNGLFKQRGVSCARVRNLVVTIGPAGGRHLLINSHYDSVPVGPGASDAGMGVATMLEVASILRSRPPARPVTLLFNEGEELGLIGARAFLDADPLSGQVDSLINLEARGVRGPANMFETSVPNTAAVRVFKDAARNPVANSLAVSAYRKLPNYTDVNTFADRGWLTLNFAPIGNETRYHSPGDDLAALDRATLQHMGDQTLAVAEGLTNGPPPQPTANELLFMSVPLLGLLVLPLWAGVAALAGLLVLYGGAVTVRRAWLAVPVLLAAVVLGTALAWLGLALVGGVRGGQFWRAYPALSELAVYAGVIAAGVALLWAGRRLSVRQLRAAWWLLFLAVGVLTMVAAPGGIVYFLLPPTIAGIGTLLAGRWPRAETIGALLAALASWLTIGAMLGLLEEMLNGGPLWLFAPLGALVLMPWLIEAKPLLEGARGRVAAALAGLAVLAWVPAALAPAYSADRQQQWTLEYVVDPVARQPVWSVVNDRMPLPAGWRRFGDWRLGTVPGLSARQRWIAPAPPVAGTVPAVAIPIEQARAPGGRRVRLRLQPNGADSVLLTASEQATIRAMGVPGQVRAVGGEGSGPYRLNCTGRSCSGQVVELLVGPQPVELTVVGTRWSLPPAAAPLKAAQPRNARAQYLPDATVTVSRLRV